MTILENTTCEIPFLAAYCKKKQVQYHPIKCLKILNKLLVPCFQVI